ncbi:phosphoenolpyruvate carboxylase [uncultured Ruegeria sp.]|uniref:phosphoenolpyruvate carboxylase n=1 Tax=uncultured Ruegeria sp. TaxID=259304 RepID=UPI00263A01F2|nr:phosphoenolpyruvate carboxylase [uncultured Ruegeria sp.]
MLREVHFQQLVETLTNVIARQENEACASAVGMMLRLDRDQIQPSTQPQELRALTILLQFANLMQVTAPEDSEHAVRKLQKDLTKFRASDPDLFKDTVKNVCLELVLTAHPTEIKRQSIQRIERELYDTLLQDPTVADPQKLYRSVLTLWNTAQSRGSKLSIFDEIVNGVSVLLHSVLPAAVGLMKILDRHPTSGLVRFASWIGGDRDGNPFVDATTLEFAAVEHATAILAYYMVQVRALERKLSLDDSLIDVPETVKALVAETIDVPQHYATESFRLALCGIHQRLAGFSRVLKGSGPKESTDYSASRFQAELQIISDALHALDLRELYQDELDLLIATVDVFGFRMASIDLRQNSSKHEILVAELLSKVATPTDYASLNEKERVRLLTGMLENARPLWVQGMDLSEESQSEVAIFRMAGKLRDEIDSEIITNSIISNTESVSDILELAVLLQNFGLLNETTAIAVLPVPLFETIDDLRRAPGIMDELLSIPAYRQLVQAHGGCQQIMLGYSDSNKDGGIVTARWEVSKAETELARTISRHGLSARFFHGRGGSIGRGSGTVAEAIAAQPKVPSSLRFRVTEQGEVLSKRFANPQQSTVHLCELISGVTKFGMSFGEDRQTVADADGLLEGLSQNAYRSYRDLVQKTPGFVTFMRQATILDYIASLNMGSRPVSRGQIDNLSQLRAIPWVFSWGQSRFMLPAWYGFGAAVDQMNSGDRADLTRLYQHSDFFRGMIDGMALSMSKVDMDIAHQYAQLVEDAAIRTEIFGKIRDDWALCVGALGDIRQQALKDTNADFASRRQLVAHLNNSQVVLLGQLRRDSENPDLQNALKLTINGIAAGLQYTG